MLLTPPIAIAAMIGFLGLSFFLALAESALFALGKWQVRQLAEQSPRLGSRVMKLLETPQDLLAAIVLGTTISNGVMVLITLVVAVRYGWNVIGSILVLGATILLACEVVPKTLAVRNPELWAIRIALPMLALQRILHPFRIVAQSVNSALLGYCIPKSIIPQSTPTDEDVEELFELGYQQGTLALSEKEIILEILSLDRRSADDAMIPRAQMACISDDLPVEEMIAAARKYKHRRLPMFDETPDTIVGVLNTRTLLLNPDIDFSEAMEFPSFVPESMNLLELLKSMQRQRRGMAIVLDEFGGTAGCVTVEDILEEIVGDIRGEGEVEERDCQQIGPGRWRVKGSMSIEDFLELHPALGEVEGVDTMGGLLTAQLEVVPNPGQWAVFRGLRLTALQTDERRVRELTVEIDRGRRGKEVA